MINIPNAAGFIPSESVIDGIAKLYNLFSPEAKAKRQADLAYTQAQTGHVGAETTAIPSRTAQGFMTAGADVTRAQNDANRVPIEQQRTDILGKQQLSSADLGLGELDLNKEKLGEEKRRNIAHEDETRQQLNQLGEQFKQNFELKKLELGEEGKRTDILGKNADTQSQREDDLARTQKIKNIHDMMLGMDPNTQEAKFLRSYIYQNVAPEVKAALDKHEQEVMKLRDEQLARGKSKRPAKGPVRPPTEPGLPTLFGD